MKLEKENLIVKRSYKEVYKLEDEVIKVFAPFHSKAAVFNEALNTARVEETGLDIPKVKEVTTVNGNWALVVEYKEGQTLEELMESDPTNIETYMSQFVSLQLGMHEKKNPSLNKLKDKLMVQIDSLKEIDATTRYELHTRLESMPKHNKLCHGDFNPSNVIVGEDGSMTIIDWAHATQGNASADVARTFLILSMQGKEELADKYLNLFSLKSGISVKYIQEWIPLVAASQMTKGIKEEQEFLSKWISVADYQ